jgi:hypothetical protein
LAARQFKVTQMQDGIAGTDEAVDLFLDEVELRRSVFKEFGVVGYDQRLYSL